MATAFDPYRMWLGIPPEEQPPHHYRLLGLGLFEGDADVIQEAADRQMAHVQTHKLGAHAAASQKLLNELATAKLCLLNPSKKSAYDAALEARLTAAAPPVPAQEVHEAPPPTTGYDFASSTTTFRPRKRVQKRSFPVLPLVLFIVVCGATGGLYYKMYQTGSPLGFLRSSTEPPPTSPEPKVPDAPPPKPAAPKLPPRITPAAPAPTANIGGRGVILDNGGAGFAQTGSAWTLQQAPVAFRADLHAAPPGAGANVVRWSATRLAPDKVYEICATWPAAPDLASDAHFTIRDGENVLATVQVDQRTSPGDDQGQGALWKNLGRYQPSAGTLVVELSDAANGRVIADAVRFRETAGPAAPPSGVGTLTPDAAMLSQIVDDNESDFSTVGDGWEIEELGHTGSEHAHPGGKGAAAAAWKLERLDPTKNYQISVTWSPQPQSARNAPYSVLSGSEVLLAVRVDQRAAPGDAVDAGATWKHLGVLRAPGGKLEVRLTDEAAGPVVADAVRVVAVGDPLTTPEAAAKLLFPAATSQGGPPPAAGEARTALRAVRAKMLEDFRRARKPQERAAVAEKFLDAATTASPAERWVLLEQARDLAVLAGNLPLVIQIEERVASNFAVDMYSELAEALEKLRRESLTIPQRKELATSVWALAERAIQADSHEAARRLLALAQSTARGTDASLVKQLVNRAANLEHAKERYEEARRAAANASAADPAAKLAVGKYLCLVRSDWAGGLPYLVGGSDSALADLARAEIALPRSTDEQVALGDRWYAAAESGSAEDRSGLLLRAQAWYEAALPQASGLSQARITKRLSEMGAAPTIAAAPPIERPSMLTDRKAPKTPKAPKAPVAASPAAGPKTIAFRIRQAIKDKTLVETPLEGGYRDSSDASFKEIPPAGGVLIGFNYTLEEYDRRLTAIQAIYRTSSGTTLGTWYGRQSRGGGSIVANKNYAVTGINLNKGWGIQSFEVVFARVSRTGMKPEDTYTSSAIGDPDLERVAKLSSQGQPVVGIRGKRSYAISSIGFIHLPGQ